MKWSRSNGYPVSFSARLKPLNKFSLQRLGMERVATDNRWWKDSAEFSSSPTKEIEKMDFEILEKFNLDFLLADSDFNKI